MDRVRKYFDLKKEENFHSLDERVCGDLNIEELYTFTNHTKSKVGEQYYYHLLRNLSSGDKIKQFEDWMSKISADTDTHNEIIELLKKLNKSDAYDIYPVLVQNYHPYSKRKVRLFKILQFLPTLLIGLFIITKQPFLIILTIIAFFVNLALHYLSKNIAFLYSGSMPQLYTLLVIVEKLQSMPINDVIHPNMNQLLKKLFTLKRNLSVFRVGVKLESDMAIFVWGISEFVKIFFLSDPVNLNKTFTQIRHNKEELKDVFDYVGLIDTLQSIATMRQLAPYYCYPKFEENTEIKATDIYHPLIPDCVSNTFTLDHHSFLVIGSNMSGKTSFIRTIGINALLAQTTNTCFAKEMILPRQKIYTSISMSDDLMEGQSYYLREVLQMKHIIECTRQGYNLILLDELFRGTNTIERVAGAKAVLDYLVQNLKNIVLVATHDIELIDLLKEQYTPIYFSEDIQEGELSFNYKINYKQNPQKNAIRILGLYDFPESVIEDALNIAEKISDLKKR